MSLTKILRPNFYFIIEKEYKKKNVKEFDKCTKKYENEKMN